MKWIPITLFVFFVALLAPSPAKSLDFGRLGGTLTLDGGIKKGDYIKFLRYFAEWEVAPTIFHISSQGGNVDEAKLIGNFIRLTQIPVHTGVECFSSCVFIYIAGVERYVSSEGKIGLHRPYFEKHYFSNLNSLEAEELYVNLQNKVKKYMSVMGVSQQIIERMFSTNSKRIDYLTSNEADIAFGNSTPFYEEWLISKCGTTSLKQAEIFSSISNLEAARMTVAAMQDPDFDRAEGFGSNILQLVEGSQLALKLEKTGQLNQHKLDLDTRNECLRKAKNYHIIGWHNSIKENIDEVVTGLSQ